MPITATLLKAQQGNSGNNLLVEFIDGDEVATHKYRDYKDSPSDFVSLIRSQASQREAVKTYDFSSHVGKTIDLTPPVVEEPEPPVVIPPTAEEIARDAWLADYRRLNSMLNVTEAIPALSTTQSDNAIAALRVSLEADWLNSYLEYIR